MNPAKAKKSISMLKNKQNLISSMRIELLQQQPICISF